VPQRDINNVGLKSLRENPSLSPVGTSESSPGRSPGLEMRHRAVPKGRLKIWTQCSAVPRGTVELAYHYPGLRPGLLSDVPTGLSAEVLTQTLAPVFFLAQEQRQGLKPGPLRTGFTARLKSCPDTKPEPRIRLPNKFKKIKDRERMPSLPSRWAKCPKQLRLLPLQSA
jgi:hypothetical protein